MMRAEDPPPVPAPNPYVTAIVVAAVTAGVTAAATELAKWGAEHLRARFTPPPDPPAKRGRK